MTDPSDTTTADSVAANLEVFESDDRVHAYDATGGLTPAEAVLVERWIEPGARVLDLGMGTGRTYPALAALGGSYVGIDYAAAMVAAASAEYPDGDFRVGDASDLSAFGDASFDAVVFSYNGLDYLQPFELRERTLAEVMRVLRPGGVFLMSTHNPRAVVRLPPRASAPAGVPRAVAIGAIGTARAVRALAPSMAFRTGAGYERDRIQQLMTYFATPRRLVEELERSGLRVVDVVAGDHPRPLRSLVSPWTYVAAVRPSEPGGSVERVEGAPGIAALASIWDDLVAEVPSGPFQSRAWFEAWSQHLAPDAEPVVLVARSDTGVVSGILPLARMSRRLHQRVGLRLRYLGLAGAGPGAAEHLGPLCADDATAARLFAAAAAAAGSDSLLLENLTPRAAAVAAAVTGARAVRSTSCPASTRPGDGAFSDRWSAKMRKNVRRRSRQLEEAGVVARWVPAGPDFAAALRSLRAVHAQRWNARGTDGLFDERREDFLNDLAVRAVPPFQPWVLLLEQEGRVVAGLLGFRHVESFSVYKTGWDPDLARLGPGIALGVEAMRWAEEQGLTTFDYLRGPRGHKSDLGCEPIDDPTVLVARGVGGRLLEWRERLSADGVRPAWIDAARERLR